MTVLPFFYLSVSRNYSSLCVCLSQTPLAFSLHSLPCSHPQALRRPRGSVTPLALPLSLLPPPLASPCLHQPASGLHVQPRPWQSLLCFHGLDPYFQDLLCFLVHLITLWKISPSNLENGCVRVSFLCPSVPFLLLPHLIDGSDWVQIMKGDSFSHRTFKALLHCILAFLLPMEGLVLLILIPLCAIFFLISKSFIYP